MLLKLTCNILAISTILSLTGCDSISDEEVMNYRSIDAAFERSNEQIESNIHQIFRALEDKMSDPATQEEGTYWYQKADSVRTLIENTKEYISQLKNQLKTMAGLKAGKNFQEQYEEKNTRAVKKLFTHDKIQELERMIKACRKQTLAVDPGFAETFQHTLPMGVDSLQQSFKGLSAIAAIARLSQFQSDLKVSEKMLIEYCFRKVPPPYHGYDQFFPLTFGHNSVYYPGEKAEINAGIGAFSSKAIPEITVNGKKAERTPEGYYQYKFKVTDKPGAYYKEVIVKYVDPNTGVPVTIKKNIQYKVIPKCPE